MLLLGLSYVRADGIQNDIVVDANGCVMTVTQSAEYGVALLTAKYDVVFFGNIPDVIVSPCDFNFHSAIGLG